ncbi:hypothetical protein RND81_08G117400 [Saponaria officinalis]
MRPSIIPNFTTSANGNVDMAELYYLEDGGCPRGTVPIRRLSEEDLVREAMFSKKRVYNQTNGPTVGQGTHFAILQTASSPDTPKYLGVQATFSVWNPQVKETQYSAAQITIQNGPQSLQTGWMVNPTMYKDGLTHVFIHTNVGQSNCYNVYCSGFVSVRSDLPPDVTIRGYCEPGKRPSLVFKFYIYRDQASGNWWLSLTEQNIPIGFWPANIFTNNLKNYGTYVSCGGETFSPLDYPGGYPLMGRGQYPLGILDQDAFATYFDIVNENYEVIRVNLDDTDRFEDTNKYKLITDDDNKYIFYGGYGG